MNNFRKQKKSSKSYKKEKKCFKININEIKQSGKQSPLLFSAKALGQLELL